MDNKKLIYHLAKNAKSINYRVDGEAPHYRIDAGDAIIIIHCREDTGRIFCRINKPGEHAFVDIGNISGNEPLFDLMYERYHAVQMSSRHADFLRTLDSELRKDNNLVIDRNTVWHSQGVPVELGKYLYCKNFYDLEVIKIQIPLLTTMGMGIFTIRVRDIDEYPDVARFLADYKNREYREGQEQLSKVLPNLAELKEKIELEESVISSGRSSVIKV